MARLAILVALLLLYPASSAVAAVSVPVPALPDSSGLNNAKALRGCDPGPRPPALVPRNYRGVGANDPNPLVGERFLVSPVEPSWKQWQSYVRAGQQQNAARMWKIASQPKFGWFGKWTRPDMQYKVREFLRCAQVVQPGSVPLMVVLRHQGKRCGGGYDGGGRTEDEATRKWYRDFREAVGAARVVIGFEVDSLGTADCFKGQRYKDRLNLLRDGVDQLSQLPNATIYLEAGASDWEPAKRTAKQLRYIGIHKVRGFMLNATHYDWTRNNIRHGLKISKRTGGKHFIINTAWNGRGPVHFRKYYSKRRWRQVNLYCHPQYRGAGISPTTKTNHPKVDAYLWIGRTGYSGGSCNGGPLPIGSWWAERALMFAKYQTSWIRPPKGTKHGHKKRLSARKLGWCGEKPCP